MLLQTSLEQFLLANGALQLARNAAGYSALDLAAMAASPHAVQLLLDAGAEVSPLATRTHLTLASFLINLIYVTFTVACTHASCAASSSSSLLTRDAQDVARTLMLPDLSPDVLELLRSKRTLVYSAFSAHSLIAMLLCRHARE